MESVARAGRELRHRCADHRAGEHVAGVVHTGVNARVCDERGECAQRAAVLVSNNRYRLGRAVGSGTRPWREWSAPTFEVDAHGPVPQASTAMRSCSIHR